MAGWFRRKKKKVADQANVSKVVVAGQPLQAGQVETFDTSQRLARARARLRLCQIKIDQLKKQGADTESWEKEYRRRQVQIDTLGG
jgi:nicotinic acid mononucleotide adenylyltransferase